MLYIWPLFAFFSAPLVLSWIIQTVSDLFNGEQPQSSTSQKSSTSTPNPYATFLNLAGYASLPPLTLAIVKFNTIIHPFTLADNRHYMFYVFRYSILRAPWVRFALAPVYIICGVLCWKTVAGFGQDNQVVDAANNSQVHKPLNPTESNGKTVATKTSNAKNGRKDDNKEEKKKEEEEEGADNQRPDALHDHLSSPTSTSTLAPSLSTALLWILATTLSLFTAPLVEPRYFILPWVFWRLLLPAWPLPPKAAAAAPGFLKRLGQRYDLRLWVESVWFVLINVVTMYIFITRPFYWYSPDGKVADGGNVQRFMW